jgi:hypothetical protein
MMKKILAALAAMVLAGSFALPLNAAPIGVPKAAPIHTADVEQVKHRGHGNGYANGHWRIGGTLIATVGITARATVRGITAIPDTAIATIIPTIVGQA